MLVIVALILARGLPLAISGQELTCHVKGQCSGGTVVAVPQQAESYNICLEACKNTPNSEWLTFYQDTKRCVLLDSCQKVDTTCDNCLVGQVECEAEQPSATSYGMLLVVGGTRDASSKVELMDLTAEDRVCPSLPDYPGGDYGSVGTYMNNTARFCGGNPVTKKCYYLNQGDYGWVQTVSMLESRLSAAGVQLSPTEWWITGGYNGDYKDSTEVYITNQDSFFPYVNLPEVKNDHNLLQVNDTHFVLLGTGETPSSKAWMFDNNVQEWKTLPDMTEERRWTHAGLVKYPDGHQAVVVAGSSNSKTSEILDLDLEGGQMTWRYGPDLPVTSSLCGGASVQFKDSFIIVGGCTADPPAGPAVDTIYTFDPSIENWLELPQKLTLGRFWHAAILVPNDFAQCV